MQIARISISLSQVIQKGCHVRMIRTKDCFINGDSFFEIADSIFEFIYFRLDQAKQLMALSGFKRVFPTLCQEKRKGFFGMHKRLVIQRLRRKCETIASQGFCVLQVIFPEFLFQELDGLLMELKRRLEISLVSECDGQVVAFGRDCFQILLFTLLSAFKAYPSRESGTIIPSRKTEKIRASARYVEVKWFWLKFLEFT